MESFHFEMTKMTLIQFALVDILEFNLEFTVFGAAIFGEPRWVGKVLQPTSYWSCPDEFVFEPSLYCTRVNPLLTRWPLSGSEKKQKL